MEFFESDFQKFIEGGRQVLPFLRMTLTQFMEELFAREAAEFVAQHDGKRMPDGRRRVARGGSYSRTIVSPVGNLSLSLPRVRVRASEEGGGIQFQPSMIPRYMRKLEAVEDAIPYLYLKGVSSGDFEGAFRQLYGEDVKGFSGNTILSLTRSWTTEFQAWSGRDLSDGPEYPYVIAAGIFFPVRGEKENQPVLTVMGVNSEGAKELLAVRSACSESAESWRELFQGLNERGLKSPRLVVADAGRGLWSGLNQVFPDCAGQTCWEHKIRNVQSFLPKSLHVQARGELKQVFLSPGRKQAERAIKSFSGHFGRKYPKAVESVTKNEEHLLTFFGFPAEHWTHIRTTNIIESIFSTVRNRTHKMRGISSIETMAAMVYKLVQLASPRLRKITASALLKDVCAGKLFVDGMPAPKQAPKAGGKKG